MILDQCIACGRFLDKVHIPWHSQKHPDMRVGEWLKQLVHRVEIPCDTEIDPVCPNSKCQGKNILDVVLVPNGATTDKHVVGSDGQIIAYLKNWDQDFEQPPEESRYWCQDCEAYITPEWEKVK